MPHSTTPPTVLLFGQDPLLLETRRWVLEREGYRLFSILGPGGWQHLPSEEPINLVLLCSSLSAKARSAALGLTGELWPGAPIVVMTTYFQPWATQRPVTQVNGMDGPTAMVSAVRELLGNAAT